MSFQVINTQVTNNTIANATNQPSASGVPSSTYVISGTAIFTGATISGTNTYYIPILNSSGSQITLPSCTVTDVTLVGIGSLSNSGLTLVTPVVKVASTSVSIVSTSAPSNPVDLNSTTNYITSFTGLNTHILCNGKNPTGSQSVYAYLSVDITNGGADIPVASYSFNVNIVCSK
jgi:hypothetical protein